MSDREIDTTFRNASAFLRDNDMESAARLLMAVYEASVMEVIKCLDPRHRTTIEEAEKAVFAASPYMQALVWAKELTK